MAASADSLSAAAMYTVPSSLMSIWAPVSSTIFLMILPPGPMMSLIFSGFTLMVVILGAYFFSCFRGSAMHSSILPRMKARPFLAWARAAWRMSLVSPSTLISIWMAVIPLEVPATLKSISPLASSSPWISVRMVKFSPSFTRPMATPETGALMGTPASIRDRVLAQVLAMEEDPLDSSTSDTRRMV